MLINKYKCLAWGVVAASLLAYAFFAPICPVAAAAAGLEELFGVSQSGQQGAEQPFGEAGEGAVTPLPKPGIAGYTDPLKLEWELRIFPPDANSLGNLHDADDFAMLRQNYPPWLSQSSLWLFVTLTPVQKGSYFYAPFAIRQTNQGVTSGAARVMPTSLELAGPDGAPLPGARSFYPPGSIKKDSFTGFELPVYDREITIAASFPANFTGREIQLKLEALICTASSCTPFRKIFSISPVLGDIKTRLPAMSLPDARLVYELNFYRSAPFTSTEETAAATADASQNAGPENSLNQTRNRPLYQQEQSDSKNMLAYYITRLEPRFHQDSLEVKNAGQAVLLGLMAGLILNFMPCVLPVISLKLGTLLGLGGWSSLKGGGEGARQGRRRFRLFALCFSLGIFVWFGFLFCVIGFAGFMWGQLLQSQTILMGMTLLLFVMALSLFGLARIPVPHASVNAKSALPWQGFCGGLLATLLATPCSGPLLGAVLGWAVTQSLPYLALTLASVALGMASPFLLIILCPGLARRLPAPGPWSKKLETVMAFVLLGTVLYIVSMLPQHKQIVVLGACLLLSFCAWIWTETKTSRKPGLARLLAMVLALCALYAPFVYTPVDTGWNSFEAEAFQSDLGRRNLLLNFTADWCINCRAMEMTTLTGQRLERWTSAYNLTCIQVDLTRTNPDGEALLQAMGSASIPLLAIIPAQSPLKPTVLRDLVTPGQLENALRSSLR